MADETDPAGESEGRSGPPPSPFRYLALVFLILFLEGGGAYLYLDKLIPAREGDAVEEAGEVGESLFATAQEADPIYYEELIDLVVTPGPAQSGYLVKASLALKVYPEGVIAELATKHDVIQDLVLQTLESHSVRQLRDPRKQQVKDKLKRALNAELRNGEVRAVYFTDLVMQ